jgi:hypothetical protein
MWAQAQQEVAQALRMYGFVTIVSNAVLIEC